MKKCKSMIYVFILSLLLTCSCGKEEKENTVQKPDQRPQQEGQEKEDQPKEEEAPALTSIPTWEERMDYLQNHSTEERAAYQEQLYALLNQCGPQEIDDGLKQELEAWSAKAGGAVFDQVEIECSQDPLLMWSGGDKRQYRNITATLRLFYDPSAIQGQEKQRMEALLEEAQQVVRQSPYGLKLISAELIFVDQNTDYPNYSAQVSLGVPGKDDPSAPISPEEQGLQTLAYEKVSAFCQQEFTGGQFEGLPYANMTLSRFGAAEGSQVLECEVRVMEGGGEEALAAKLEELAQQLADGWMEQGESLKALGVTTAKISFDLRDSPEGPLVFELPLGGA